MKLILKHTILKFSLAVLTCVFLLPSAVKLTHAFNHHEHQVCYGVDEIHFHALDLDCDFYKFKLQTDHLDLPVYEEDLVKISDYREIVTKPKKSSSTSIPFFNLRAPPLNS